MLMSEPDGLNLSLDDMPAKVADPSGFAVFLNELAASIKHEPEEWAHGSIEEFLLAWSAWITEAETAPGTARKLVDSATLSWGALGEMLLAARAWE